MDKLDVLNRDTFVEQLVRLMNNLSDNKSSTCFAINGAWGCGKSFLLDIFEERLGEIQSENTSKDKYFVVRYNSWKYDYYEEPLVAIVSTMICNGVQREHNKKLNNGLPILHKVPPKRDYGRYFCIMAEKGGTSHGGLTEKLSPFFHAKKQEVNAYGR